MRRRYIVFAVLVFVALLVGSAFWPTDGARAVPFGKSSAVRGRVVGPDGRPIGDVLIRAWHRGISLGKEIRTSRDGIYEIPFSKGARLDFLVFFHPDFEPLVLDNLSAEGDSQTVTTLYPAGERPASPQAVYARLEAAERLVFLALTAKGPYRYSALNTLREWDMAGRVDRLSIPGDFIRDGQLVADHESVVHDMLAAKQRFVIETYRKAQGAR